MIEINLSLPRLFYREGSDAVVSTIGGVQKLSTGTHRDLRRIVGAVEFWGKVDTVCISRRGPDAGAYWKTEIVEAISVITKINFPFGVARISSRRSPSVCSTRTVLPRNAGS